MTNDMDVDEPKIEKSNGDVKKKRTSHSPSPIRESGKEKRRPKEESTSSSQRSKDKDRKEVEKSSSSRSMDKEKEADRHRSKEKSVRRRSRSREDDRRKHRSRSIEREKGADRHRDSRDRDRRSRKRSTSRDRSRHTSRDRDYRRRRSPSPRRSHRRSPSPRRSNRRSPSPRRRRRSPPWRRTTRLPGPERRDVMYFQPSHSMPEGANPNMTPDERDERTIFILQLARDTKPTDLETFFESVGPVRDVRIITDSRTGRSKGIAYIEFWERESVALALGLNKQRLLGAPLIIQQSCAERNRQAAQTLGGALGFTTSFNATGPMKLVVENLHPDINDKMLLDIFEPFGKVSVCKVARGPDRNSLGYANLGFKNADDAKKVLEQLNGYEIAGRALRIKIEEQEESKPSPPHEPHRERLEKDEKMELGHTGRLHVMAKLAEGSGMDVPKATLDISSTFNQQATVPPYATTTFFLSGLFDPATETGENWDQEIADDVITECNQYGGVWHIFVDKNAADGNVYIKCPTVLVAANCVAALHGRYFAGRMVTANYLPASSYHEMFPESRFASALLQPRR
uniref:RRM domain-containing protein n=1 Tax=Panagrolaimus sp. PS1159 TaxID=55785 RepID=A0AC35GMK6_9BILA